MLDRFRLFGKMRTHPGCAQWNMVLEGQDYVELRADLVIGRVGTLTYILK